ncbi:hypothetical protein M153_21080001436 [Pseudoloma neurophilia]|uniref:Uncharacterized protein n=1 Tax=Pseudoloma neurophilia TaxID=146866 RepID=A0A0R0M2A1_9MICR|nr:hypothetical protein M153_21080001436 [Pseudoloma neurophilia]
MTIKSQDNKKDPLLSKKDPLLSMRDESIYNNVYFTNFCVLSICSILFAISLIISLANGTGSFLVFCTQLNGIYTISFAVMQLKAFFAPFILKYHEDEQSPAARFSIISAVFCIVIPIFFLTRAFWSPGFILKLLTSFILFSNSISCISKRYRESALTFWINIGYVIMALFLSSLCLLLGIPSFFVSFSIIGVYCLFCLGKSYEKADQPLFNDKPDNNDTLFTVLMAMISFSLISALFLYEFCHDYKIVPV